MTPLKLGADAVAHLIPHRRPFVFVDGIEGFERSPHPTLVGIKHVSINEPVFEGHFPGMSLWPGVYTVEGMGQTVNALIVLLAILEGAERRDRSEEEVWAALRAIDRRLRLGARSLTGPENELLARLGEPRDRVGLAGAMDIKFEEPVFAGCMLRYRVSQTHVVGNARRFEVSARVGRTRVARGTMTSAVIGTP